MFAPATIYIQLDKTYRVACFKTNTYRVPQDYPLPHPLTSVLLTSVSIYISCGEGLYNYTGLFDLLQHFTPCHKTMVVSSYSKPIL